MRVVGLTGGIGSGKSSVARMLSELGADVVDADEIARLVVVRGSPALEAIVATFGREILDPDGNLDRKKLARIVFKNETARGDLNRIVHPAVRERSSREIAERVRAGSKLVVYDVPLLFEAGLEKDFPNVVVVDVSPEIQRERIRARDGLLTPEEIDDRISAQLPLVEKVRRATHVIDNRGSLEETRAQVRILFGRLRDAESAKSNASDGNSDANDAKDCEG